MKHTRRGAIRLAGALLLSSTTSPTVAFAGMHDQIEANSTARQNAEIARRQIEVHNRGDVVGASKFFAENTKNHGVAVGRQGVLRVLTDIESTFPDWYMEVQDLTAIGDDVIVRGTVSGTHKGTGKIPVNGGLLVGVAPTGKTFKVQHIHWFTFVDGLIVEHRANRDDVGMMQQLGLLPPVKRYDLTQS